MHDVRPWLVVFDLDGTLIDSSLDLCRSVNAALAYVDVPQLPDSVIASYVGDGAATLMRRALGAAEESDEQVERNGKEQRFKAAFEHFLAFYREHKLDNTRVYDGVLGALSEMRANDAHLQMAVLTNKPVRPSREICDALGISDFIFVNYGGDSFKTKKPNPQGLQQVIAEARIRRAREFGDPASLRLSGVTMVGDSEVDVFTAKRAGVRSLGCLYGLAAPAMQAALPDQLCSSPHEWPSLLGLRHQTAGQSQAAPRTPLESP